MNSMTIMISAKYPEYIAEFMRELTPADLIDLGNLLKVEREDVEHFIHEWEAKIRAGETFRVEDAVKRVRFM